MRRQEAGAWPLGGAQSTTSVAWIPPGCARASLRILIDDDDRRSGRIRPRSVYSSLMVRKSYRVHRARSTRRDDLSVLAWVSQNRRTEWRQGARFAGPATGSVEYCLRSIRNSRLQDDPRDTLQDLVRRAWCLLAHVAPSYLSDALTLLVSHLGTEPACWCCAAPSPLRRAEPSSLVRKSASRRRPCRSDIPSWRERGPGDRLACGAVLFIDLSRSGLQAPVESGHGCLAVRIGCDCVRFAAGHA